MRVDRHFIKQQYDLCGHIRDVAELQLRYRQRDVSWPVVYDTETTGLDFGVPNVLFDPELETVVSEQLHPVVFGVSMAFVVQSRYVGDSPNYPKPICQNCGKECDRFEEVNVAGKWEVWCYCKTCDAETNHPIPGWNGMCLLWARRGTGLYKAVVRLLADDSQKLWHNAKYDLRVCEASGIKVGGVQDCSLVMSRLWWNRRRSHSLKKLTEFLCPVLSQWASPIDKELTRLKGKYTRMIKAGELEWYEGVDYANYSFISEQVMSKYASLDAFMTLMLWLRLQSECVWR